MYSIVIVSQEHNSNFHFSAGIPNRLVVQGAGVDQNVAVHCKCVYCSRARNIDISFQCNKNQASYSGIMGMVVRYRSLTNVQNVCM